MTMPTAGAVGIETDVYVKCTTGRISEFETIVHRFCSHSHGPNLKRYSGEVMKALTSSA